jgi:hypothetical protein
MQSSGLPETPATASQQEPTTQEPEPLTMEKVEQLIETKATRIAQSMVDKAEHRISAKAQAQIGALKETQSTLGLTDEQVEQATQKIVMNDFMNVPKKEETPPPDQTTPDDEDPVIAEITQIFQEEGIQIEQDDPEFTALDKILKDPNGNIRLLRKELYKQIEAKKQRVSANTEQAEARVISSGATQTGEATVTSAKDYWSNAHTYP